MADIGIVENVAKLLRQVRRRLADWVAYRDFSELLSKRDAIGAVLKTRAQGIGIALARFVSGVRRTAWHHENNRAHDVLISDLIIGGVGLVQFELRFDVAVGNFQA